MKRLTFDGLFCDIAKCDSTPGGTFCESGTCTQRRVWERLKEYEDTGLEPEQVMYWARFKKEYPELFECDISETVESCEECGFCEVKAEKETLNEQGCRHCGK